MSRKQTAIPADIGDYLRYEESTGFLYWTKSSGKRKSIGSRAGYVQPNGYVSVSFRRRKHPAAQIIHFMKTGVTAIEMDHIDLDPGNNRWANLRSATSHQNMANRRGWGPHLKGVYLDKRRGGFSSTITFAGKSHYLGRFATEVEAHAAYVAAAAKYHGEFARTE